MIRDRAAEGSNITRVDRDAGIVIYYEYDALQRLRREKWQDDTPQVIYSYEYDYDATGNRTEIVKDGVTTNSFLRKTPDFGIY